ncbi:glycosyltransferase family 4 protein [Demetria terragena]|uniref:glycosyltransferase family 4 protein n=1 Tax=Demetria terragena TaxID=63959 RepID=UPI0003826CC1|nr:glycosyltransferase family 4 protein [Demetria terragena]
MKIAYVTACYPFGVGEEFLDAELRALLDQGVEPVLVPTNYRGMRKRDLPPDLAAIPVFEWQAAKPMVALRMAARRSGALARVARTLPADRAHLTKNLLTVPGGAAVAAMITQRGLTRVHAHWMSTSSTLAMVAANLADVPLSISCHRWDIYDANLMNAKARAATFVRVISDRAAGLVRDRIDADLHERVRVIHMGVEIDDIAAPSAPSPPEATKQITMVANLIPVKGHQHLIAALRLVRDRGIAAELDLIGSGERDAELRALVAQHDLTDAVNFVGQLHRPDVLKRYADGLADVVVLSSVDLGQGLHEGIPVSLMEAMAAGVPVVSTTTGSIPELIEDGTSGLLVPAEDPEALADALVRVLTDPGFARALAERAAERVQQDFSAPACAQQLLEALR